MKFSVVFLFLILLSGTAFAQKTPEQKIMDKFEPETSKEPYFYNASPLLIIQDGKETYRLDKSVILDEIDSSWIDSMDVLKGDEATKKYGKEGKDGVVVITLKGDEENAVIFLQNLKNKSKKQL